MQTEALASLRLAAETIGRDNSALEAAGAAALTQRAALLEDVIAAIRPALRAISSRVGASLTESRAGTTSEPFPWRGCYLAGSGPERVKPTLSSGDQLRARYGGKRLMLRADGVLVELSYDGPWSTVPGEVSSWKASEQTVPSTSVVARYDLEAILGELAKVLEAQSDGNAAKRAQQLAEQAERLRSLRTLLRSWR